MRFACDTGGTFTDLLVESDEDLRMYKAHTTPGDPAQGVLDALRLAATDRGLTVAELLERGRELIHGTTHAINAIITGKTARTAFLTTEGHPDVLVIREGGRPDPFDHATPYPRPYIPRSLTFEVPGRIGPTGAILKPLDEAALDAVIDRLAAAKVEAVAVCFLWSIVNPAHELRVGERLKSYLPGVPFTLSHALNPTLREYRRASATAIDASLKPLMTRYLGGLEQRLRGAGFNGRLLVLTSQGGAMDAATLGQTPIHAINSGPSLAPIAGRYYGRAEGNPRNVVVADTGGTTFDVSLVRDGEIPWTRETWIGKPYLGHMTGFPSVDVKSVGAGGGSIAHVDRGGVLHVGPRSAGSIPGPVCYGRGGVEPTVTDACVALGYIDPDYFLGGALKLDARAARQAVDTHVAQKLGVGVERAAVAIIDLVTESMVQAIAAITLNQGIDPRSATLIGGGGAAGLNSVLIGTRLACDSVIFPQAGAALSAAGALISDLNAEYRAICFGRSESLDFEVLNATLARLAEQCAAYARGPGRSAHSHEIAFAAEARYPSQVWDIEIPLPGGTLSPDDVDGMVNTFHEAHRALFAVADESSPIEITSLACRVRCRLRNTPLGALAHAHARGTARDSRPIYFPGTGWTETPVRRLAELEPNTSARGPAIVETPFTTIVVNPGASFFLSAAGNLIVKPGAVRP